MKLTPEQVKESGKLLADLATIDNQVAAIRKCSLHGDARVGINFSTGSRDANIGLTTCDVDGEGRSLYALILEILSCKKQRIRKTLKSFGVTLPEEISDGY